MVPGHVLLDPTGAIVEADEDFGELLMSDSASLRGRNVLSFTAPADREECTQAIKGLHATGRSFDIIKRFIRQDESVVWVRNSVSKMTIQKRPMVVVTCTPVQKSPLRRTPEALLNSARVHAAMLDAQVKVAGPVRLTGPGWSIFLELYIAEAEGRLVGIEELAAYAGQSIALTRRWVEALASSGTLEVETRDPMPDTAKAYRLTLSAVHRLEDYLIQFAGPTPC